MSQNGKDEKHAAQRQGLMSFTLYGRPDSSNCQKVSWLLDELQQPFEMVLAGANNVLNKTNPDYRRISPTGLVPVLKHEDAQGKDFYIDESNTILRYLVQVIDLPLARQLGGLSSPQHQARISRWQDFCLTIEAANRPVFLHFCRPGNAISEAELDRARSAAHSAWLLVDSQLEGRVYLAENHFSIAEITLGAQLHRYLTLDFGVRPHVPNLYVLYDRLKERPLYLKHIVNQPLSGAKK